MNHLTYCLNVHPGESWAEVFASIREKAMAVRDRVQRRAGIPARRPFGLGLRLGHDAALELSRPERLDEFHAFLKTNDLYVPMINGFPYGRFHGAGVKEQVYAPDWTTPERLDYTCRLGDILARLLPEGMSGSISTVPGSFRPWIRGEADREKTIRHLQETAAHFARLKDETGRTIHLGLEPEPGCYLETTAETVNFFKSLYTAGAHEELLREHIGVCLDACHAAVGFESPAEALALYQREGIRISRVQLSAAPAVSGWLHAEEALAGFEEPTYLHQVGARFPNGSLKKWTDLPEARKAWQGAEEIRVHCHVPLYWEGTGRLSSTARLLDASFFESLKASLTEHMEIETYTFHVLPEELQREGVVESLAREYEWCGARL